MAISLRNFAASGSLQIEVESPTQSADYGTNLSAALQSLAAFVAGGIEQMQPEQRPGDLEITCGLRARGGGFVIGADLTAANFRVTLTWRNAAQGMPAASGPTGQSGDLGE
jgi:hypothetical protein